MKRPILFLLILYFFSHHMPFGFVTIMLYDLTMTLLDVRKPIASADERPATAPPSDKTSSTSQAS